MKTAPTNKHPLGQSVKRIFCCCCGHDVEARLTDGQELYAHRPDLWALPFWLCDTCGNFVGCHYKTNDRTRPLGNIPTPELKEARKHLHALIDPIWQSGRMTRRDLYAAISRDIGWKFHTAEVRSIEDARTAYIAARKYA